MLEKRYRLNARYFKKKSVYSNPFFTLATSPNSESYPRIGFVISKKTAKKAVVRNRTKRQARACVEEHWMMIKGGLDMMFYLKRNAVETESSILCRALLSCLEKEELLK